MAMECSQTTAAKKVGHVVPIYREVTLQPCPGQRQLLSQLSSLTLVILGVVLLLLYLDYRIDALEARFNQRCSKETRVE